MQPVDKLRENMEELERKLGRSVDPVMVLIEITNGLDRYGNELAERLVTAGALTKDSPLVRELQEVPRDQRILAANHAARYLYATSVQQQITGTDGGPVKFDVTKLLADPAAAAALDALQLQLRHDEKENS